MSLFRLALLSLLLCASGVVHAKRVALVIGNDAYQQVTRLDKAGNDAQAMARELEAAGFEVALKRDLGFRKMVVAFEEFYDRVKGGDEVVVFYAGHGVQTEKGAYLLPTDIEGETQSQVEKMSYSVNNLLEELDRVKARFSLVIVDACRDNPLRSRGRTIGIARGLNAPDIAKGQMVIFSAGRNQRALDSLPGADPNPNGVFTRELLVRMRAPGRQVEALAIEVKNAVEKLAASVKHEQRPLIVNDSSGDFSFYPLAASKRDSAPVVAAPEPTTREDRFWDDARGADAVEAYEAYLAAYPQGRYRALARVHLGRLGRGDTVVAQLTRGVPEPAPAEPQAAPAPAGGRDPGLGAALPPAQAPTAAAPPRPAAAVEPAVQPPLPADAPLALAPATVSPTLAGAVARTSYTLPNGDRYEGEVVGASRTGRGTLVFANKDRYVGQFVDNLYEGEGELRLFSGETYTGSFRRGLKNGTGVQIFPNGDRYEGPFVDDKPHGKGSATLANGDRFVGSYVAGVRHGMAVYTFANGDRYEGPMVDGQFNGRGRLESANGDHYEGDFRDGLKNGRGTQRFANKDRYEGEFVAGMQQGRGEYFFANGNRYEGEFVGGFQHGKGTHRFASGQTKAVEYVKGVEK